MTKKKSKNNKKKVYKPNLGDKKGKLYTVEDIEKMSDPMFLFNAGSDAKRFSVAAAYASDILEMAKDNGVSLDLTLETENDLYEQVIPRLLLFKRGQGKGDDWAREQIEKSLAAYQLFLLCNFVNEAGKETGFRGTIEMKKDSGLGLAVVASNTKNHKTVRFNPYAEIRKVSEECFSFGAEPSDFVISLAPFRKEVEEKLISKMADTVDDEDADMA